LGFIRPNHNKNGKYSNTEVLASSDRP